MVSTKKTGLSFDAAFFMRTLDAGQAVERTQEHKALILITFASNQYAIDTRFEIVIAQQFWDATKVCKRAYVTFRKGFLTS